MEWHRDEFCISTDSARLDVGAIHDYLTRSYWAEGIPREVVARSISHSLNFGLYRERRQIGFARVVTDRATFAYLADVYVLEEFRGRGLGTWLVRTVRAHPELQGLRRWMLLTRDAHGLYEPAGFRAVARPERCMEIHDPEVYRRAAGPAAERRSGE